VRITLPTDMVAERVGRVWLLLAFTGCSALTAVAALAFAFARWAGRPIRQLEEATHQLADGGQATPVAVTSGPPEIRSLAAAFNRTAAATTGGLDAMVRLPSAQSHEPPAGKPGPRRREAPVLRA
jgi:HAMP domain-containing protein